MLCQANVGCRFRLLLCCCYMVFLIHLFSFLYVYIQLLFANLFCYLKSTENSKKRNSIQARFIVLFRILVRISQCLCLCFLHPYIDVDCLFLLNKHVVFKWYVTNDSVLLICGLLKEEFCQNFGAILDFPGIPNKSKS